LQTQQEFTLEVKRWKARWELYPTGKVRPGHLCETLELVSKKILSVVNTNDTSLSQNVTSMFDIHSQPLSEDAL
jgi:hypothetical protein